VRLRAISADHRCRCVAFGWCAVGNKKEASFTICNLIRSSFFIPFPPCLLPRYPSLIRSNRQNEAPRRYRYTRQPQPIKSSPRSRRRLRIRRHLCRRQPPPVFTRAGTTKCISWSRFQGHKEQQRSRDHSYRRARWLLCVTSTPLAETHHLHRPHIVIVTEDLVLMHIFCSPRSRRTARACYAQVYGAYVEEV
jgi:hypothetical protein